MVIDGNKISREMIFLCIGNDIEKLDKSTIKKENFRGIEFYIVDDKWRIIWGSEKLHCSCNERYCWHIFKALSNKL